MEIKEAVIEAIAEVSSGLVEPTQRAFAEEETQNILIDIKEEGEETAQNGVPDEVAVLLNLKEKSLVLFEGLKHTKDATLEMKLEMVIGYLEYQLYTIEERLKTLHEASQASAKKGKQESQRQENQR